MAAPGYPGLSGGRLNDSILRRVFNSILQGRLNNAGQMSCTTATISTTVIFAPIGAKSRVFLSPRTAHAAAAVASTYVSTVIAGTGFVVTHPSDANADKTFDWAVLGGM